MHETTLAPTSVLNSSASQGILTAMTPMESVVGRLSVAELARMCGQSVEQIVALALAPSPASASKPAAKAPTKLARGGLSLKAALGVLTGLGQPARLEDVRAKVGGSVPQVRAALQKLAKAGQVKITGERRGTRYHAA